MCVSVCEACGCGFFIYMNIYICFAYCLLCMYVYRQRQRQQNRLGLTFISPFHAVSCVLAPLQLPPRLCAVLPQAAATHVMLALAGGMQMLQQPWLMPPFLHVPLDVLCSSVQPGQQTEPAEGSPAPPGRCRRGALPCPCALCCRDRREH